MGHEQSVKVRKVKIGQLCPASETGANPCYYFPSDTSYSGSKFNAQHALTPKGVGGLHIKMYISLKLWFTVIKHIKKTIETIFLNEHGSFQIYSTFAPTPFVTQM